MSRCIDIHCHRRRADACLRIISVDTSDFCQTDWHGQSYSLGLHPWFVDQQDCAEALHKIESMLEDCNMLAVGECGLDRLSTAPMSLQETVFRAQLQLAGQAKKPIIIHCVRAFNELLRIKKTEKIASPWLIHGFNANVQIAEQLLAHGCYLSFGKTLLRAGSNAARVLALTPVSQVFLETDEADGFLDAIYVAAAAIKCLDLRVLQEHIEHNFNRVFLHD